MSHNIIITGIPDSVSSLQLKVLLKEVCHIHLKAKNIVETKSNGQKVMILDIGEYVIPKIARRRILQLGLQVLPGLEVYMPRNLKKDFKNGLPKPIQTSFEIPPFDNEPLQVSIAVVEWLHYELHLKYPQLKAFDDKYDGKIYRSLAQTITERVINMLDMQKINLHKRATIKLYRSWHPYFADFELVLSHIHTVENQSNSSPSELSEADLLVPTSPPPYEAQLEESWNDNRHVLEKKVQEYIASLDTEVKPDDSDEMIARKKVRQAMKEFSCQIPQILTYKPFKDYADTTEWISLFLLGEPGLPNGNMLEKFLNQHGLLCYDVVSGINSFSSAQIYIARSNYDKIMELDGCEPDFKQFNVPSNPVATNKLYIRHLNEDYCKEQIFPAQIATLKKWNANRSKMAPAPPIKRLEPVVAPRPSSTPFRSTWRFTPPNPKKFKPNPFAKGPRFPR